MEIIKLVWLSVLRLLLRFVFSLFLCLTEYTGSYTAISATQH